MRTNLIYWTVAALSAATLPYATAWADDASQPTRQAEGTSAKMRVSIDPETGEFRPAPPARELPAGTAEDPATLRARSVDDLVEEVNPAGGYTIDLKRRFGGVSKATTSGTDLEVECEAGQQTGSSD